MKGAWSSKTCHDDGVEFVGGSVAGGLATLPECMGCWLSWVWLDVLQKLRHSQGSPLELLFFVASCHGKEVGERVVGA